jgi:hypothetical protein
VRREERDEKGLAALDTYQLGAIGAMPLEAVGHLELADIIAAATPPQQIRGIHAIDSDTRAAGSWGGEAACRDGRIER